MLQTRGEHDGCWGDDGTYYHAMEFSPGKLHNLIWRRVGMISGVISDSSGTALYADDTFHRVRYILLNSHYAPYEEKEDGSAKYSTFRYARFGQQQYDWLVEEGLQVPAGWGIIVGCHVPLSDGYMPLYGEMSGQGLLMRRLLEAYNARDVFSGRVDGTMGWDAVEVTADFTHAAGEVIAAVAGHNHADEEILYEIPVITSSCDAAVEESAIAQALRIRGTVTEQSFDVFTVDRAHRMIYATKIGAGADRVISY